MLRRLARDALALRGEAEFLQHLRVQVDQDRLGVALDAVALRPLEVALVPVAHVLVGRRQLVVVDAVVLRVHLPLPRVGLAAHELLAALAAPAGEEADARARLGLVVDDEVGVVAELARAVRAARTPGTSRRPASSISTSWNGLHSPVGGTTGMRTESTGPSNSEIGRSSIDITSWRSRYVVSGSTRSANAVISDWNASQTTRNGILYSPSSRSVVEHRADLATCSSSSSTPCWP